MTKKVSLSDVAEVILGQTFRGKAETEDESSAVRLIQIKDIKEGNMSSYNALTYANLDSTKKLKVCLQNNDLLFPLRGTRYEAMIIDIPDLDVAITTTNQVAIIRVKSSLVTLDYLSWYFNSDIGHSALRLIQSGTTIPSITSKGLANLKIDLPGLDVQTKIVRIYQNWLEQKNTFHEIAENGKRLTGRMYQKLLSIDE